MALDLVSPQIPDGNASKGPELFAQTMGSGLAAAAHFASMKRQSEDEMLKLATQERIAQDQHAFEREKLYKDSEVQDALTKAHTQYYKDAGDALKIRAQAFVQGTSNILAFNQQRAALVDDVNEQANKLQLNDPAFATKDPVKFAANVMQFKDMFGLSPLPEVKNAVQKFQAIADQQKIPLKVGATYDTENEKWVGGAHQTVPIWQVVRNLQDPTQAEMTLNALKATGHVTTETYEVPGDPKSLPLWQKLVNYGWEKHPAFAPKNETKTRDKLDAQAQQIMDESKAVPFRHVPSRVPPAMLPKSAGKGTDGPTELPPPDLPPDNTDANGMPQASAQPAFSPTQTDLYIQHAKDAIAGGAPKDAVAARLQQDFGIDPQLLWAT
jgi:hypothetical protein